MVVRSSIDAAALVANNSLVCEKFPKSSRLTKRREFGKVSKFGSRHSGKWIFLEVLSNKERTSRLGITVTKKFGPSHERNRFKRLVREAYRRVKLPPVDIIVRPRSRPARMQDIQQDLIDILHAES